MGYTHERIFKILEDLQDAGEIILWNTAIETPNESYTSMTLIGLIMKQLIKEYDIETNIRPFT